MRTRRLWKYVCLSVSAGTLAHAALAQPVAIEDLARLPAMTSVSVSTDGKTMAALIGPSTGNDQDRAVLAAWDLTDLSKPPVIAAPDGKQSEFIQVTALKDGKLQVAVRQPFTGRLSGCAEGNAVGTTRTWSVKALLTDTTFRKFDEPFINLGSTRGIGKSTEDCIRITARGAVTARMPLDPENILISRIGPDFRSELGLLNVKTQAFRSVFKNSSDAFAGYIDPVDGEVMSTSGSDEKRNTFEQYTQLKATKGGAFEDHPALTVDRARLRQELSIAHRDRETGLYYVITNKFADKNEIYTYDPVRKAFSEKPVFSNPEFDASAVVTSTSPDDFGKVLGYAYDADVTRYEWLDAEYGGIVLGLEQQLGAETVNIIYRSPDYSLIVFSASGSTMPARYYILRDRSRLELLGAERPWIDAAALSQTGLVYYEARDGRRLPALFTPRQGWKAGDAPGKAVVLPHGGPWARDYGGWDPSGWVPFLTSRGYSVLQPQYRGSVGWGIDLWRAGDSQYGYKAQDDKDDGAAWLVAQGYAAPDKIVMFGYSYGGYAAMAAVTRPNSPYRCAIAGAGYAESAKINTGFDRTRFNRMFLEGLSGRDVIKDVANASIPILIYHGDRDVRVPDTYGKAFYNAVRKHTTAKYVNIPDMPHSLPWTPSQQRLSLQEIENFLTGECGLK